MNHAELISHSAIVGLIPILLDPNLGRFGFGPELSMEDQRAQRVAAVVYSHSNKAVDWTVRLS